MRPLEPVSPAARVTMGIGFFVLFVAVWAFFTLGGFVSPTFLASPVTMVQEGWLLFTEFGFLHDIGMTVWRVVGGFTMAAIVAVGIGAGLGRAVTRRWRLRREAARRAASAPSSKS